MIKKFLRSHLSTFLEGWQNEILLKGPQAKSLDLLVHDYLKSNKAMGSHDRQFFRENVYQLIKQKVYLDVISPKPLSWDSRLDALNSDTFNSHRANPTILPTFELISNSLGQEKAVETCTAQCLRAPLTVRVNPLKISRDELLSQWLVLRGFSVKATEYSPLGITFLGNQHENLYALSEFKKGYFEIQDEASQLAAQKVGCTPGQTVLDYCSGSGGKSLAFAHQMKGVGQIYLHDIREFMLGEAQQRFAKAGVRNAQFLSSNSLQKQRSQLLGKFDWVVCDVPCSGTGTLRRNPDLKFKLSNERIKFFVDLQAKIVREALPFVNKDTGRLVYSTCSVLQEENMGQIARICKEEGMEITNDTHFQTVPSQDLHLDGFFCAVLNFTKK